MVITLALALAFGDPRVYSGTTAVPADPSVPSVVVATTPKNGTSHSSGDGRDEPASSRDPSTSPDEPEAIFPRRRRRELLAPEERAELPRQSSEGARFGPVGPPGQRRREVDAFESRPTGAEPTAHELGQWQHRRRRLKGTVATFATFAGVGALLAFLPFVGGGDGEDGTGLVPVFASGAALLTLGAAGTALSAPFLGHHVRWDRPSDLARTAPPQAAYRAQRHTHRLFVALGVEGGLVLAGGLSVGIGFAAAAACPDTQDLDCTGRRLVAGGIPGYTLIGLGGLAMVSTGVLIGLQKRHGHTEGSGPRLTALSPSAMAIRF